MEGSVQFVNETDFNVTVSRDSIDYYDTNVAIEVTLVLVFIVLWSAVGAFLAYLLVCRLEAIEDPEYVNMEVVEPFVLDHREAAVNCFKSDPESTTTF